MKHDTLHNLCIGGPQGPRSTCKYKGDLKPQYTSMNKGTFGPLVIVHV